jgi:HKD family nuclease
MGLINQPREDSVGHILSTTLESNDTSEESEFHIITAYAKRSGVQRIANSIRQFRARGGMAVGVVGLDQRITTIQGLQELHRSVDELYVYHSETPSQTFHPKVYVVENRNRDAVVFVGSSNLTAGGLWSNYEAAYQKSYNLQCEPDATEFATIRQMIESYKDTASPCCKLVTDTLMDALIRQNYLANEEVSFHFPTSETGGQTFEPIFGTERFTPPTPSIRTISETPAEAAASQVQTMPLGFWKVLSKFDVSTKSAPGQIQIPIRFINLFPTFSARETTLANASQAEAFFNIIFIDSSSIVYRVDGVRIILYFPAPHHPRPNHELRFTFRNTRISGLLEEGDILEFKRSMDPDIWFQIRLLKHGTGTHRKLYRTGKYDFVRK